MEDEWRVSTLRAVRKYGLEAGPHWTQYILGLQWRLDAGCVPVGSKNHVSRCNKAVEDANGYQKDGTRERAHILANHADCAVSRSQLNRVAGCPSVTHRTISQGG